MSARNVGYDDYGIDDEQLKDILLQIRNDSQAQDTFLMCCREVKPELANDIFYTLTGHVSYDDLKMIKSVPIPKIDFYGYRRKAVALYFKKTRKDVHQLLDGQMHFEDLTL